MADTELQQLQKTDRNPVQETRYQELLRSGGGSSGNSGNTDFNSLTQNALKMYQDANKPAIESLQASIPEIQQKYEQTGQYLQKQVGSLEERYKGLLDELKGNKSEELGRVQTNTSQELGRRGISAEGGLFGQTMTEALNPITRYYTGQEKQLQGSQQSALDSLMNAIRGNTQGGIESQRAVQNAIAQLQAGAGASGIQTGLQMLQQQQQQANLDREFNANQASASLVANQKKTSIETIGGRMVLVTYDQNGNVTNRQDLGASSSGGAVIDNPYADTNTNGSSYSNYVDSIVKQFGMQAAIDNGLVGQNVYSK